MLSGILLGAASSCSRPEAITASCGEAAVRTVTALPSTVTFDKALQRYKIMSSEAGSLDVVNVGVVCGTLPEAVRAEGTKVIFTGTYKTYPTPPVAPGGYTVYYLALTDTSKLSSPLCHLPHPVAFLEKTQEGNRVGQVV